jgi:toxin ParE1/3/4
MAKVTWTHDALDNMNEIADKAAELSVNYAALLVKRFFEAEKHLAKFPKIGRIVPEMASFPNLREVIIEGYRIVYEFDDELNEIKILGVKHSSKPLSGN